jgi:hypothetical protein
LYVFAPYVAANMLGLVYVFKCFSYIGHITVAYIQYQKDIEKQEENDKEMEKLNRPAGLEVMDEVTNAHSSQSEFRLSVLPIEDNANTPKRKLSEIISKPTQYLDRKISSTVRKLGEYLYEHQHFVSNKFMFKTFIYANCFFVLFPLLIFFGCSQYRDNPRGNCSERTPVELAIIGMIMVIIQTL